MRLLLVGISLSSLANQRDRNCREAVAAESKTLFLAGFQKAGLLLDFGVATVRRGSDRTPILISHQLELFPASFATVGVILNESIFSFLLEMTINFPPLFFVASLLAIDPSHVLPGPIS